MKEELFIVDAKVLKAVAGIIGEPCAASKVLKEGAKMKKPVYFGRRHDKNTCFMVVEKRLC